MSNNNDACPVCAGDGGYYYIVSWNDGYNARLQWADCKKCGGFGFIPATPPSPPPSTSATNEPPRDGAGG